MDYSHLTPIEAVALEIARADMHYVATSLISLPSSEAAAEFALLQYGAMAAFEAQVHFRKTLGWHLEAEWDLETARAARMSGKFFADNQRNLDGVVAHFGQLIEANHGAFFPPDRRGRIFDFLRDDMGVAIVGGVPYASLVCAHYLIGLDAEQVAKWDAVGPAVRRLSTGVGNVTASLLAGSDIAWHGHGPSPEFTWLDGKSWIALPRLFGGGLSSPMSAALMTIHCIAVSALFSASRSLCVWCEKAARKHRFIALFQSLTALAIMRRDAIQPKGSEEMMALLDEPETVWMLHQSRLRNGLVHLGLQDVANELPPGSTVDQVVLAYTGRDAEVFAELVETQLSRFVGTLTRWMLLPNESGKSFIDAFHPAPSD